MSEKKLKVVLCWHMHQPQYQDLINGRHILPWAYLHGIKDYTDMAGILEEIDTARAVVNFTPVLLDQLATYSLQIGKFAQVNEPIDDPLLNALGGAVLPANPEARLQLIRLCLHANETNMIQRYPAYARLVDLARVQLGRPELLPYVTEQFLFDLIVWFHLAWLGETVKRNSRQVQVLLDKGKGFTLHDRRELLGFVGALLADIIPRYRRLHEAGRIELSVSPQHHPIMPLLLEFAAANESEPDVRLPGLLAYPGGAARVQWHLQEGIRTFQRHFGFVPAGCWPSEGGVSERVLAAMAAEGFRWFATGEKVLDHSLERYGLSRPDCKDRPYRVKDIDAVVFFRDDQLSDLIGFSYAAWNADDAVADFVHQLEEKLQACHDHQEGVVSVILDGENAWENYPANGYDFLTRLYEALVEHPQLELTTFSDCLAPPEARTELPGVVAGSWVYGNFSTWIGTADKNRAWELLGEAKQRVDAALKNDELGESDRELVLQQLGICEASDWFWWLGGNRSEEGVSSFERLFRHHLANLYLLVGDEPPEHLTVPMSHGGGRSEPTGTMRRST